MPVTQLENLINELCSLAFKAIHNLHLINFCMFLSLLLLTAEATHLFSQADPPSELPLCPPWKSIWLLKAHLRHCCFCSPFLGHFSHSSEYYSNSEIFRKIFTKPRVSGKQGLCLLSQFIQHTLFSTFCMIGPLLCARDSKLY